MTDRNDPNEYRKLHVLCPGCGSEDVAHTCVGHLMVNWTRYRDDNRASCAHCGWRGIVHDLVPRPA